MGNANNYNRQKINHQSAVALRDLKCRCVGKRRRRSQEARQLLQAFRILVFFHLFLDEGSHHSDGVWFVSNFTNQVLHVDLDGGVPRKGHPSICRRFLETYNVLVAVCMSQDVISKSWIVFQRGLQILLRYLPGSFPMKNSVINLAFGTAGINHVTNRLGLLGKLNHLLVLIGFLLGHDHVQK